MSKKILLLTLGIIILIAIFLRFYQLGSIPPSPDWDEAALGYNAYSILLTGKDEFGKFLPVVLESFGDYKPALYTYLAIPTIFIFGLNTFAVRFPSAFFGVLSVIITFFIVEEVFAEKKYKDQIALAASFFLAISPWSIQFSRVAFEANTGVAFNLLMVLFFLKGLKKPWFLTLSTIFAGLAIYTYQSEKVFVPILAIILVAVYLKDLIKINIKYLVIAFIAGLVVVLPMVLFIFNNPVALERAKGTSLFSSQTQILKDNVNSVARDTKNSDVFGALLDNRRFIYFDQIIGGYLSHFDPNWLFITGDISRHHAPGMGLLYLFELPLLLIGIYGLLFGEYDIKTKLLVFFWFLVVPIPAAVTNDVPHAVRTLNFLPTPQIFIALGLVTAYYWVSSIEYRAFNIKVAKLLTIIYLLFAIFNISYFLDQYFVQLNYYDAADWQYGYSQAFSAIQTLGKKADKVVVSSNRPLDNSYIFFLFYTKFSPSEYQALNNQNGSEKKFGNFIFRPINWSQDSKEGNTVFVVGPNEIPGSIIPFTTIYYPDGTTAIKIVKN